MKNWIRSLSAKIICFILCVVFLTVTVLSVVGAVYMIAGQFYVLPKEYVKESLFEDMLRSDSNNILWHHIGDEEYHYYSVYDYDPTITNVRYTVVSPEGEVFGTNSYFTSFDFSFKWIFYKDKDGNYTEIDYYFEGAENKENADIYTVNMSVDPDLSVKDQYFFFDLVIDVTYSLLYWIYPIGIFSLIAFAACFIILMCTSGRRPDSEELHQGLFSQIPIDILIGLCTLGIYAMFWFIWDVIYTGEVVATVLSIVGALISANIILGLFITVAYRIKAKTLLSNTLIWIIAKLIFKLFKSLFKSIAFMLRAIPLVWKTSVFALANLLTDFILLLMVWNYNDAGFILWLLKALLILPLIIYCALMLRKLEKGGEALASGDLSGRIDTAKMFGNFKKHGENLNSISAGMATAVEKRLQSERMKTELITNVSHDIKTPLTSIINYSRLIAENDCNCEKHSEYSEVLLRKSEHLKRLLDDLVEISKASTGNLEVSLSSCDAAVLIAQAEGEFREKCESAKLTFICSFPDRPLYMMADPRRIWRVFENIMSNACKYSLPNSRVYLTLEKEGDDVVFTFRNTSREAIKVSGEELTQRFVRGDSSRTTEGNGLGLSIAKSLTELQGGTMDITIDGDLFKVTLRFPEI